MPFLSHLQKMSANRCDAIDATPVFSVCLFCHIQKRCDAWLFCMSFFLYVFTEFVFGSRVLFCHIQKRCDAWLFCMSCLHRHSTDTRQRVSVDTQQTHDRHTTDTRQTHDSLHSRVSIDTRQSSQ